MYIFVVLIDYLVDVVVKDKSHCYKCNLITRVLKFIQDISLQLQSGSAVSFFKVFGCVRVWGGGKWVIFIFLSESLNLFTL